MKYTKPELTPEEKEQLSAYISNSSATSVRWKLGLPYDSIERLLDGSASSRLVQKYRDNGKALDLLYRTPEHSPAPLALTEPERWALGQLTKRDSSYLKRIMSLESLDKLTALGLVGYVRNLENLQYNVFITPAGRAWVAANRADIPT